MPESPLPDASLLRADLDLPEVSELDIVRHYVKLSQMNYAIDKGLPMPWTEKVIQKIRPEKHHYDHQSWGTLTSYRGKM